MPEFVKRRVKGRLEGMGRLILDIVRLTSIINAKYYEDDDELRLDGVLVGVLVH